MDVSDEEDIDFHDISETLDKNVDNTRRRWDILLKGMGGIFAGKRFKVRDVTKKMIEDIKTKHERYVPWIGNKANSRNGSN